MEKKLRAYLTRSFNLLPHMSMGVGLQKDANKKNHFGYPLRAEERAESVGEIKG